MTDVRIRPQAYVTVRPMARRKKPPPNARHLASGRAHVPFALGELNKILATKAQEVAAQKASVSLDEMKELTIVPIFNDFCGSLSPLTQNNPTNDAKIPVAARAKANIIPSFPNATTQIGRASCRERV